MRCYLAPDRWAEGPVTLDREEAHYLTDVLRVRAGQTVELFDGAGRVAPATVELVSRRQVTVVAGPSVLHPRPIPAFHLVQALPKAQKMDFIVQKATELGAQRIQPVHTRYAVARPDERRGGRKTDRWQAVALAAARQCGVAHVPRVAPVVHLEAWLISPNRPALILVGDLRDTAEAARDVLEPMRSSPPESVAVLIGPEGDLAAEELHALAEVGARFVSLGSSTLRTETAALYAVGLLRYVFR